MRRWARARATGAFVCLAAVLAIVASGCSSATPGRAVPAGESPAPTNGPNTPTASNSPLLERKAFTSDNGGFSIQQPRGWAADTSRQAGTDVIFRNPRPDSDKTGSFAANISVLRRPGTASLEVLVGTVKAQIGQQFAGYQFAEDEAVDTIGGLRAHLLGGRFTQNRLQLRDLQLIVVDGSGNGYVVLGRTLESFFFRNEAIFRASLPTLVPSG